jgi:DNA-binding NarL/FixJ family response regulator
MGRVQAVRVVIVDDHAVFAEALSAALDAVDDLTTVGTAYSLAEAFALVEETNPDVAVVDYRLPDGRGSELITKLRDQGSDVRVVILTASADEVAFLDALDAGCAGYVTKDRPLVDVVDSVRAAAGGELAVSPTLLGRVLPQLRRDEAARSTLTAREREILELVADGVPNKTIAVQLSLRLNTVRNHVQNVLTKLGAHSKLEAVAIATRSGLIRSRDQP